MWCAITFKIVMTIFVTNTNRPWLLTVWGSHQDHAQLHLVHVQCSFGIFSHVLTVKTIFIFTFFAALSVIYILSCFSVIRAVLCGNCVKPNQVRLQLLRLFIHLLSYKVCCFYSDWVYTNVWSHMCECMGCKRERGKERASSWWMRCSE